MHDLEGGTLIRRNVVFGALIALVLAFGASFAAASANRSAKATLNVRETPIPMQFPDWNAWLPTVHPLDVWPDGGAATGSFSKGSCRSREFLP